MNSSFKHDRLITDAQAYEVDGDGYTSHYKTGLIIPKNASDLSVSVGDEVVLDSFELIDQELYLNISTDEFRMFNIYNPQTDVSDINVKGFLVSVSYILSNGIKVEYPTIIAEVGEFVTFKLILEDENAYTSDYVRVQIKDNYELIVSKEEDFGLSSYSIDAWYTDEGLTNLADFNTIPTTSTTYYAKTSKRVNKYIVSFESNGGSLIDALENVEEGSTINEPEIPSKDQHEFVAWYADPELTIQWNFDSDVVNTDITLYAKWEEVKEPVVDDQENPEESTPAPDQTEETKEINEETPKTGISYDVFPYTITLSIALISLIMIVREKRRQ